MIFKKTQQAQQKKQQPQNQKPVKKKMVVLRLQKDIQIYNQQKIDFVQLTFPDENQLQHICVSIFPQKQSPYTNCKIKFQLIFPDSYPIDPPKIKCLDKIYHPNISYEGAVCLPLVRQDYSPTVTLTMIICGLIFILTYPNGEDALNPNIGDLLVKNKQMFQKLVNYTIHGRSFQNKKYDCILLK